MSAISSDEIISILKEEIKNYDVISRDQEDHFQNHAGFTGSHSTAKSCSHRSPGGFLKNWEV